MNKDKKQIIIGRTIGIIAALALWQLLSICLKQRILLVGPFEVVVRLFTIWKVEGFFKAVGFTLSHIFIGYGLGLLLGLICAVLAYKQSWLESFLWPWMATIRTVPVASFVVICLIWLTTGSLSIFISFLIVLPIVYQNVLTALQGIDETLIDLAKLEDIRYIKKIKTIYIPQISEQLISTAGITAGMAWKAGVAAEIIGTPQGSIGKQLYLAKIYLDTDDLLAWTVIIVLLSVGFEKLLMYLLRKLLNA